MQIIGQPIGADEVKVLTGQKRRLSLIECNQSFSPDKNVGNVKCWLFVYFSL